MSERSSRPHGFYDGPLRTFGWTLHRWVLIPSLTWDLFCSSERPNWRTWTIVDGLHVENDWETLAGSFLGNRFCDHWRTLKTHDSNRPGKNKWVTTTSLTWQDARRKKTSTIRKLGHWNQDQLVFSSFPMPGSLPANAIHAEVLCHFAQISDIFAFVPSLVLFESGPFN